VRSILDNRARPPVGARAAPFLATALAWAATLVGGSAPAAAQVPGPAPSSDTTVLTLARALAEAHTANARLPAARLALQGAVARTRQARGQLYPVLSLDGDVHGGAPTKFASGDALLAVFARAPLYEGGALRAGVARSDAEAQSLEAGYRRAVRDVDYAVRVGYGRMLRADSTLSFRRRALDRLRAYLAVVQARQASGQGVGADVLRTRQRVAAARADLAAVKRDRDEARMELNDLVGRDPGAPLRLAPLPEPQAVPDTAGQPWQSAPDVAEAAAGIRAAQADVRAARAGRKPHVALEIDAGTEPVLGSFDAPLNNGRGPLGTEAVLSFTLPFWDHGIHRGRMEEANAALDQARQQETLVRRAARLAWTRAAADAADLSGELQARNDAAGVARDAYLQAESLYRGGQGSALDVLDAYDAWISAGQDRLDVIYAWRVARAELQRWGNP
jgi:outer membrane protein TolC